MQGFTDVMCHLTNTVQWDVLLLQEVVPVGQSWPETIEGALGGHRVVFNPQRLHDSMLVIHRKWQGRLDYIINDCEWGGTRETS